MVRPISFISEKEKNKKEGLVDYSFNNFINNGVTIDQSEVSTPTDVSKKVKSKAKKKKTNVKEKTHTKKLSNGDEIILADDSDSGGLEMYQSNEPYAETYHETNDMLKVSIMQMDTISTELKSDLDYIRASKTLKNKYKYIPELASTLGSLMNTKVTAIREINKTITDSHNLELKRVKDLKLNEVDKQDDDKYIMDMYNSFISTPVGGAPPQIAPSMNDMTLRSGIQNIVRANIGEDDFTSYQNNMTPTQNAMRHEHNPDIKTVVIYDQETGRRWFDIINVRTGESIPNVPRPDNMFLEDTVIDINSKVARNTNLDQTYPVILAGGSSLKY